MSVINTFKIITKEPCPWCYKAKALLKQHNLPYEEVSLPYSMSREEFIALAEKHDTTKTVPKIFLRGKLIGGYEDLVDWIDNYGGYGEESL